MADANEPRLLKPLRPDPHDMDITTGDAGRDGFTRIARARVQSRPADEPDSPFASYGDYVAPGEIGPPVGRRDYRRGPRYED